MGTTIREALAAANKKLMGKIDDAMNNEVFKEIQDEEAATIYEVIYKVYTPRMYRRRGEYGGMADPYNIEIEGGTSRGGVMAVVNLTDPNPGGCMSEGQVTTGKNLPELIEYGHGYKFYQYDFPKQGAAYMGPRPFTAKTIEHLKASKAHITALKAGLQRQGVKVK
ncbi:hypothetical protein [Duncaniella muris]|jgi:hypothetical protein|uniref:hypothetical protein n=2 Tax=Pseudomonadati TaxID=3379134 RepID=UPI0027341F83|nr:hypothetical protein [Duncaniella muris]